MADALESTAHFPPLHRVLVVESRHSVRYEVLKSLAASRLFEEVIEPESLSDALDRIGRDEFDACIIGSSVRPEPRANFIKRATERTKARDCAFIVLIREGTNGITVEDADRTLSWPCTKKEFSEGLVLGVLSASNKRSWVARVNAVAPEIVRLAAPSRAAFRVNERRTEASPPRQEEVFDEPLSSPSAEEASLSFPDLFPTEILDLRDIIDAIQQKEVGLAPNGGPDRLARIALGQVVHKLFARAPHTAKVEQFKEFFVYCLDRWFCETVSRGPEFSVSNLKERLGSYQERFAPRNELQ